MNINNSPNMKYKRQDNQTQNLGNNNKKKYHIAYNKNANDKKCCG